MTSWKTLSTNTEETTEVVVMLVSRPCENMTLSVGTARILPSTDLYQQHQNSRPLRTLTEDQGHVWAYGKAFAPSLIKVTCNSLSEYKVNKLTFNGLSGEYKRIIMYRL
jgi:hypothetical protein